jgi:hypothetical protein
MRLPPAGLAGTRLPTGGATSAPGRPVAAAAAAPVSAVTVAKALSVVQTNPVK